MSSSASEYHWRNDQLQLDYNADLLNAPSVEVTSQVNNAEHLPASTQNGGTTVTFGIPEGRRAIEDDAFPFEHLSAIAEHESWRKEVFRPVYHMHKWWHSGSDQFSGQWLSARSHLQVSMLENYFTFLFAFREP